MGKIKNLILLLLLFSFSGFSQLYGVVQLDEDADGALQGFSIEFWDELDTDAGFGIANTTHLVTVEEDHGENGALQFMTTEYDVADYEWTKEAILFQYGDWQDDGATLFNMQGGDTYVQFTIETKKDLYYWFMMTSYDDSDQIQFSDEENAPLITASEEGNPTTVTIDLAALVDENNYDIENMELSIFYLRFWTGDGTSDSVYLHNVRFGTYVDTIVSDSADVVIDTINMPDSVNLGENLEIEIEYTISEEINIVYGIGLYNSEAVLEEILVCDTVENISTTEKSAVNLSLDLPSEGIAGADIADGSYYQIYVNILSTDWTYLTGTTAKIVIKNSSVASGIEEFISNGVIISDDNIMISNVNDVKNVRLYDIKGVEATIDVRYEENEVIISTVNLPSGFYILTVYNEFCISNIKFVK